VAGTFKERAGFHGCQMPEQLLARIIRTCSDEGELVVDPFAGSATTLVVAKKLGRRCLGFELSEEYARRGLARLEQASVGDLLEGAVNPLVSAPSTSNGKRRGASRKTVGQAVPAADAGLAGDSKRQAQPALRFEEPQGG
jgi:site-specific DNA-methyltransferase (adenine-specific)